MLDILTLHASVCVTYFCFACISMCDLLLFCMRQYMRLEIGRLCKLLITPVEGTDVGAVAGVNTNVRAQVEVEREPLAAALERALEQIVDDRRY